MSESLYFSVAVFVFVMMAIGLALTIFEFRYGQPRREDEKASVSRASTRVHSARGTAWAESR